MRRITQILFFTLIALTLVITCCGCSANNTASTESDDFSAAPEKLSDFVGEWYCSSLDSCNGGSITLTITQDGNTLNYVRDMKMSTSEASSIIKFSTEIPESNSVRADHINGNIILTDSHLYEIFDNDRQNKYTRKGTESTNVDTNNYTSNSNSNYNDNKYSNNTYSGNYGAECSLSHCDFKAKAGSSYCSRHGCCKDGCPNQKDPMIHCCNTHNCAEPDCGQHRYDAVGSKYCKTHYVHHYND